MEVLPSRVQVPMELRAKSHHSHTAGETHTLRSPTKKLAFERNQMSDTTQPKMSQQKLMTVYKVNECKKKSSHDKRQCLNWHSQADRRRNPFHVPYSTVEVRRDHSLLFLCCIFIYIPALFYHYCSAKMAYTVRTTASVSGISGFDV